MTICWKSETFFSTYPIGLKCGNEIFMCHFMSHISNCVRQDNSNILINEFYGQKQVDADCLTKAIYQMQITQFSSCWCEVHPLYVSSSHGKCFRSHFTV